MNRIYPIIIMLTLASCRKDVKLTEPYFQFDNMGVQLLSQIKLNDTLKFAGSNGSNRDYRVFKIEKVKQSVQDCSWLGSCVTYYYFDFMQIHFIRTDTILPTTTSPLTTSLIVQMELPRNVDKKNIPKDVQAKAVIHGTPVDYNAIPAPGLGWSAPYILYPDFYQSTTSTTYSNAVRTYTNVSIIKSGNNSTYIDPLYGNRYTVNEVWFDRRYGFVFFKDVFGNSWRRTN